MKIEETENTPEVFLDREKCKLTLKGKSYPENAHRFYKPILKNIIKCKKEISKSNITFDIKLEIINSISMRYIHDMIDFINKNTTSTIW